MVRATARHQCSCVTLLPADDIVIPLVAGDGGGIDLSDNTILLLSLASFSERKYSGQTDSR
jgi:hypothetical protein